MKIDEIKNIDLKLYSQTLENGLRVFVIPKEDSNNIYVTFSTKFGSSINQFIPNGKDEYLKIPPGVAHFLEHKLFEQNDGIDPFSYFTNNGADANANTSYYKTTYLFSGPDNFYDNLDYLINFVQDPYFTDENVLKEVGIIEQEIKMYEDVPFFKLYDKTVYNVFHNHPLKYSISGSVDDIKKITKEMLYDCYNTFYHPANMFIVVVGNVDAKKTIDAIFKNQKTKKFLKPSEIKINEVQEPDEVFQKSAIIKSDIEIPKVAIAIKINILNYDINELILYLNTIFALKTDSTSNLSEKLKEENLITSNLDFEHLKTNKHLVYIFYAETLNPKLVSKLIIDELNDLRITKEELERKKKVLKSLYIFKSDSIYAMNHKICNNIINYDNVILDDFKHIDKLNIDTANSIINDINLDNLTITIITNT